MQTAEYTAFPNIEARNDLQARLEVPALVRALQLPKGGRVLEIGCGRGIALPVLSKLLKPIELVGLDLEKALLDVAEAHIRATSTHARLIHGDVRSLPLPSASFDLIIDFGTCYHVANPDAALREIMRVLAPGGLFVHETPLAQHLAHPVRSFGKTLPWSTVPSLHLEKNAALWARRRKAA